MSEIITFLDAKMAEPQMYGVFHIISLGCTALLTFLLCYFYKSPTEKTIRKILLITALVVITLEVYKQFNFSFSVIEGKVDFEYQWYAFPFQFCSTPMYVMLLAALIKNHKVHNALCSYLSTFALFAGTAVMFYPSTVFVETIGINIQTMVCHGTMISLGVFLFVSGYIETNYKTLLKAIPVFSITLLTAVLLNFIANSIGIKEGHDFNMFFINPHSEPSLPVFSLIQPVLPFALEIIIYIAGFSLAAYIMLLIVKGVKALCLKMIKK